MILKTKSKPGRVRRVFKWFTLVLCALAASACGVIHHRSVGNVIHSRSRLSRAFDRWLHVTVDNGKVTISYARTDPTQAPVQWYPGFPRVPNDPRLKKIMPPREDADSAKDYLQFGVQWHMERWMEIWDRTYVFEFDQWPGKKLMPMRLVTISPWPVTTFMVTRFPLWIIILMFSIYPFVILLSAILRIWRRRRFRRAGRCVSCGYNLTGNMSGLCPECGCDATTAHRTSGQPQS